jgi:hypothetical protein
MAESKSTCFAFDFKDHSEKSAKAAAAPLGNSFFGRPITQGNVEFVTAEDELDELHRRLVDIAQSAGNPLGAC